MKSSQAIITGLVLLITVWVEFGYCLKCYECNSVHDTSCDSSMSRDSLHLKTCPPESTGCRKVEQRMKLKGEWSTRYVRQCAKRGHVSDDCDYKVGTDNIKMLYCFCNDKDGCNGGSMLYGSIFLISIAIIYHFLGYAH
ncbi:uncharacterized protein LOC115211811 [Argonauta hians]